jgi:hypothetical protein
MVDPALLSSPALGRVVVRSAPVPTGPGAPEHYAAPFLLAALFRVGPRLAFDVYHLTVRIYFYNFPSRHTAS